MRVFLIFFCLFLSVQKRLCQQCEKHQPSVISDGKMHSVFFWVSVKWTADLKALARVAANLPSFIDQVSPPDTSSFNQEIVGGVGFGENFYNKISKKTKQFRYIGRVGKHGSMPATGGDIFVHAKCSTLSKLFELVQKLLKEFGRKNLEKFEDVYGFVYKDNRDLSGFIDGTENPKTPEHRHRVTVDCNHGGTYVLTQRWVHDMEYIERLNDRTMEDIIGRTKKHSIELNPLPASSHVARMTATEQENHFEVFRQSMPYGSLAGEAGLFFISYANSTRNSDSMLDNMIGRSNGKENDMVMSISKAVSGNYWFFPGTNELDSFKSIT